MAPLPVRFSPTLPRFLVLLGLMLGVAFWVSPGAAQPGQEEDAEASAPVLWGLWTGSHGDVLHPVWPASMVCLQADAAVHLEHPAAGHAGYAFTPDRGEPSCQVVSGGFDYVVETGAGQVNGLVMRAMPRAFEQPGVTPIPVEGFALRVSGLTSEGALTIAPASSGFAVQAVTWPGLKPVTIDEGRSHWRLETAAGGGDVVVLATESGSGRSLLRWQDPGWYPLAPNLGQVLTPMALALLVSLFRGRAGDGFVRPAGRRRPAAA